MKGRGKLPLFFPRPFKNHGRQRRQGAIDGEFLIVQRNGLGILSTHIAVTGAAVKGGIGVEDLFIKALEWHADAILLAKDRGQITYNDEHGTVRVFSKTHK